jgi:CRISPR-associated exonuclease Cas4
MGTAALEVVPLSALQHYLYCPRQYALIHIENVFEDNVYTQRGQAVHRRTDEGQHEHTAEGGRVLRALPLYEDVLGLVGKADVVELLPDGTPFPVEYKHGKRDKNPLKQQADAVQLAAQALCLEYMFGVPVTTGAIYQVSSHKRRLVPIDTPLRRLVLETLAAIRAIMQHGQLPPPAADARCNLCSLAHICQPQLLYQAQHLPPPDDQLFAPT